MQLAHDPCEMGPALRSGSHPASISFGAISFGVDLVRRRSRSG
jgi:hypothetical protein